MATFDAKPTHDEFRYRQPTDTPRPFALTLLCCGLLLGGLSHAAPKESAVDHKPTSVQDLGGFCLRPAGDLTGDGTLDYVVSHKPPAPKPRVAYVLAEGERPQSQTVTEAELQRLAVRILQGPEAAPFACRPTVPAAAKVRATPKSRPSTALATAEGAGPPRYSAEKIDTPSGYLVAKALNDNGIVVGEFLVGGEFHAFRFDGVEVRDLGTLGGHDSSAAGVNAHGDTVGVSLTGEVDGMGFVNGAFISDGTIMRDLGLRWSWATDINDNRQIVGAAFIDDAGQRVHRAFLHEEGETQLLGTLGRASYSEAHAINEQGDVVGEADTFIAGTDYPSTRAFLYGDAKMTDLGALGHLCYEEESGVQECFEESVATDINNLGHSVGFSTTENAYAHAFLTADGGLEDLGTLGGSQSWAYAVNDSGQVAGTSLDAGEASYVAFLYDQGTLYDLNDLVDLPPGSDAVHLGEASDINNFGQIVSSPYLLTPQYDEVAPGGTFTREQTLGRQLRFEYWIARDPGESCTSRKAFSRLEVRIEGVRADPYGRAARNVLDRWLAADRGVRGCTPSTDWQTATLRLPKELQGETATLTFRLQSAGGAGEPTVYLRRFTVD